MIPDYREKLTDCQKNLLDEWVDDVVATTISEKTVLVILKCKNGFEIIGHGSCIDPGNFSFTTGQYYGLVQALSKLDELIGFYNQQKLYEYR